MTVAFKKVKEFLNDVWSVDFWSEDIAVAADESFRSSSRRGQGMCKEGDFFFWEGAHFGVESTIVCIRNTEKTPTSKLEIFLESSYF